MKNSEKLVINGKSYTLTQNDRNKCFLEDASEDAEDPKIIFIYDYKKWNQREKVESAYVCGSFTSWVENPAFKMTECKELSLQYLCLPKSKIIGVGNSSHPEFNFCVNGNYQNLEEVTFIPKAYVFPSFSKNLALIYSDENLEEVEKQFELAGKIKKLSDFDLSTRLGQEEISNFRLVPGTKALFRSFHPFYSTGGRSMLFETEKKRIELVQKLAEEEGIKSDINLTDDYTVFAGEEVKWLDGTEGKVVIPAYYQKIIDSKSVCNVMSEAGIVPTYDYVYTKPRDPLFYEWVKVIIAFIIDENHQAPFQIHCAIGTDRTGVFSALLGALCGASWKEVSEDYEKTNRMGIREYRSKSLLAQSLKSFLGLQDLSSVEDLQKTLWNVFTNKEICGKSVLSVEMLCALVKKLGGRLPRGLTF